LAGVAIPYLLGAAVGTLLAFGVFAGYILRQPGGFGLEGVVLLIGFGVAVGAYAFVAVTLYVGCFVRQMLALRGTRAANFGVCLAAGIVGPIASLGTGLLAVTRLGPTIDAAFVIPLAAAFPMIAGFVLLRPRS
jgi:hypothetical protein